MSGVLGPSIRSVSTPMLNIYAEPILNRYLGYTKYKASRRLIGILKSSCTNASKIAFPRRTSCPCIPFPNKNLKISCGLRVLSSPFACSLQKPQIVTSFAAVTNLPTVISLSLSSAIFKCSSRNSHNCFTSGGALSLVLSVTFSSLGFRNGHLPLSCARRYAIDSTCFSAAATFFLSLFGPLVLLVELVVVGYRFRNHRLAVR